MSDIAAIKFTFDRAARGRHAQAAAFAGGTSFWVGNDAAQNEAYENRVKGSEVTTADQTLTLGGQWSTPQLQPLFRNINAYAQRDMGYPDNGLVPPLSLLLAALSGERVPYLGGLCAAESIGRWMPAWQVFAPGVLPDNEDDPDGLGMHLFETLDASAGTITAGDGALPAQVGPVPIMAVGLGSNQTAGATFTCTNWADPETGKDIAVSLSGAAQYTQKVIGEVALASAITAGDTGIQVSATTNFTAGEYVAVFEDGLVEVARVDSLETGPTRLATAAPLVNGFTTSAKVWPLFRTATYKGSKSGSGDIAVYARPDREITLG